MCPLFTKGLSVCLVTEFDTFQKDQRPQYTDIVLCQVPWSCLCPEFLTAQILKTRIGIMTQISAKSCHDDKMRVELCHQHINKTPHAQKVH